MTTDTGMVEQCARAAFERSGRHYGGPVTNWDDLGAGKVYWLDAVTAALECLRTPTPEMVEAMRQAGTYQFVEQGHVYDEYDSDSATLADHAPAEIFAIMINAALSPSKGEGE
jgi:hypothetical protein